jgi:isopenicillin-N epimerase
LAAIPADPSEATPGSGIARLKERSRTVTDNPVGLGKAASAASEWALDDTVTFLNHGSFGACLNSILAVQRGWRDKLEKHPVQFLARDLEDLLDWTRSEIGAFIGTEADDLALMPNATAGINTVLRSLRFERGDEIIATNHAYNASLNAARFAAAQSSARVVLADIPYPIKSPDQAIEAILAAVTPRTKLAMIEHVTSPTALVLPIQKIVAALGEKGVDVLVDGAHGPGMVPVILRDFRPAYYVGSAHKWICAPKGSAFLAVRRDRQALIKPLAISSGSNDTRVDRSKFRLEFDWQGTLDPSAWLTTPAAIDGLAETLPGGWPVLMATNRNLAISAMELLARAMRTDPLAPTSMVGSMACVKLPGGPWSRSEAPRRKEMIESALRGRRFEVPLMLWPCPWLIDSGDLPPDTEFDVLLRISAQAYNYLGQYQRLASILAGFAGATRTASE